MHSGEFLKILFAESKDRTEIFRKVFDTSIYNRITSELANKLKEVKDELTEQKIEFANTASNAVLEENLKVDSKDVNELYINQFLELLKVQIEKNKDTYSEIKKRIISIETEVKKIDDKIKVYKDNQDEVDRINKEIIALEQSIQDSKLQNENSKKYKNLLKSIKDNLERYSRINDKNEEINTKIIKIKEIISVQKEQEKIVLQYNDLESEYKKNSLDYLEKEDEFFREQAGILAEKLEPNKPCPVCGSLSHPKKAKKSKNVLSKEELDLLKEQLENKQNNLQEIKERITKLSTKIETLKNELKIDDDLNEYLESLNLKLQTNNNELENAFDLINQAYKEITNKSIKLDLFDFEQFSNSVNESIIQAKEQLAKNIALKDEKENQLKDKNKKLGKINIDEIKDQFEIKEKELKDKRTEQLKISSVLDRNLNSYEILKKKSIKLQELINRFNGLEELYKTASGTLKGKLKIDFEQYVQTTYFDMIIIESNKRLLKMTDGRFELVRKESSRNISEKIALDLEVMDYYNGKKRDVKSLSGGEAFKAALCLALGLSEIIQNYSGGVQIDTLFIDEGFGTLDSESREQAINTLNNLSSNDKLIGIISHVTELQERIDRKIVVSRSQEGSKISVEC